MIVDNDCYGAAIGSVGPVGEVRLEVVVEGYDF